MPWHLEYDRETRRWHVVGPSGKRHSRHPMSRSRALRFLRALYANYSPTTKSGWERVTGNLCRSPTGQFGACDKVGSGTARSSSSRPKPTPSERAAATASEVASSGKLTKDQLVSLQKVSSLSDDALEPLKAQGLVEVVDGRPMLTSQGREVVSALRQGDPDKALDALARARADVEARQRREEERRQKEEERKRREEERQQKEEERKRRAEEREAEKKKREEEREKKRAQQRGGGGGGGRQSAAERLQQNQERVISRLPSDLPVDDLLKFSDGDELSPEAQEALAQRGLILRSPEGVQLSAGGRALVSAINRGDIRRALDALVSSQQRAQTSQREIGTPVIFKDARGQYRWLTVSSNRYRDRQGEIVSEAALKDDVEDADRSRRSLGPLRWWHLGGFVLKDPTDWRSIQATSGIDLGDCDFNTVVDGFLIESGTFYDPRIGEWAQSVADQLQVSIGFAHPPDEPKDGVYYHIRRFERSLLPRGKAANPYTYVQIQEVPMSLPTEKIRELEALGFPRDILDQLLQTLQQQSKSLEDQGVSYKDVETALRTLSDRISKFRQETEAPPSPEEQTGETENETSAPGPETPEDEMFVGDLTVKEFFTRLEQHVQTAVQNALSSIQQKSESDLMGRLLSQIKSLEGQLETLLTLPRETARPSRKETNVIHQPPDGPQLDWVQSFFRS